MPARTVKAVTAGSWFLLVVVALFAVAIASLVRRQRRESPTQAWIRAQPVIFEARAAILIHARGLQGTGWGALKGAGWPRLVVHTGGLDATIAPFDGLVSGNAMLTKGATMRRERLPAVPIVAGNHDCIRLMGDDGTGQREWKVSPRDTSVDALWGQLIAAGVTPTA
jgi:hypothetical protein